MRRSAVASTLFLWSACLATTELPSPGTTGGASGSDTSTGGGAAGSGGTNNGSGGAGGSGTGLSAADWTSAMLAVYRFEDANDLGFDSSGNALHLSPVGTGMPTQSPEHAEGMAALATTVVPHTALSSSASAFQSPPGTSLTWGAWLHAVAHPDVTDYMDAIARTGNGGYVMSRHMTGALNCTVSDGTVHNVSTPADAFPLGTWLHATCVFDNANDELSLSINGAMLAKGTVSDIVNGFQPFGVPTDEPGSGFEGLIDEAFVYAGVLSQAAVRRIHACGIDGSRCECDEAVPAAYAHCGNAHPACDMLDPCNKPSPE